MVALSVLYEPMVSMSITVLKALGERFYHETISPMICDKKEGVEGTSMAARKFPAAPAITKSIRPNSLIVAATAASIDVISRTSAERAIHLAPFLSASISFAIAYTQAPPAFPNWHAERRREGTYSWLSSAEDGGVGPEGHERFDLDGTYGPAAPRAKDNWSQNEIGTGMGLLSLKIFGLKTVEV